MATFDSNLEWFEAYLSGDLSIGEQQIFEQKLVDDPGLKQTFDEHKKLRQGVEWASLSSSLEEVKRMHQTMNDEELKFDIKESKPAFPLKRFLSIAAALILGILITTLYFIVTPGSAQLAVIDPTDPPDLYGTGGDEIPLFEEVIQVRIEHIPQENPALDLAQIRLQIFEAKTESFVIDTSTLSLVLFTPYNETISSFRDNGFEAFYTIRATGRLIPVFQLVSDSKIYSLPIAEDRWEQMLLQ